MSQKKRAMMIGLDAADPMKITELINKGRLPNLKRAIEGGVSREDRAMVGVLPSVTPPNWCTMATGSWPISHGVTCYMNHTLGKDLGIIEYNWDSRRSRNEFIWETFSKAGKKSVMLNYCEAWPPRFPDENGIYIDGSGVIPFMRCNLDYQKLITLKDGDFPTVEIPHVIKSSSNDCVVEGDQYKQMLEETEVEEIEVDDFAAEFDPVVEKEARLLLDEGGSPRDDSIARIEAAMKAPENWGFELPASAKVAAITLNDGLTRRYFVVSASDGTTYDTVSVYADRRKDEPLCTVSGKEWAWPVYDKYVDPSVDGLVKVAYAVRIVSMAEDGSAAEIFVSHAVNTEDMSLMYPRDIGRQLYDAVGPMLPFCKFGRHKTDCNDILLESVDYMHRWHEDATRWLLKEACPDWDLFYIHLHSIDFFAHWFLNPSIPGSGDDYELCGRSIDEVYEINDRYVGMILDEFVDENTSVFITSDHGAIPHDPKDEAPSLGSLSGITLGVMTELGYTVLKDREDGELEIDWTKTKAIYHRSSYVYLNVKGRDPQGIVEPEEYDALVDEIIAALYAYRHHDTGKRVVSFCLNRKEMEFVGLGGPNCGDIFVSMMPDYSHEHAYCPSTMYHMDHSLHNLCLMVGGGFKKGETLQRQIHEVDVAPTICYLTGTPMPGNVEGGVIYQALEGFDEPQF